jgi:8-oxo-dGTP pyrophosphatase MutT (NUDIX family)
MKRIIGLGGIVAFWLVWPFWVIYFRRNNRRSRVVVICGDEVLLVRGILSSSARWVLPGGGCKKNESTITAAVRELKEEVGITVAESALTPLGTYTHPSPVLAYTADYFSVELTEKPVLHLQAHEILRAEWIALNDIRGRMLQPDAAYGLKQYRPLRQESLL